MTTTNAQALDAAARFTRRRYELAAANAERLATQLPLEEIRLPFVYDEIGPAVIDLLADELIARVHDLPAA